MLDVSCLNSALHQSSVWCRYREYVPCVHAMWQSGPTCPLELCLELGHQNLSCHFNNTRSPKRPTTTQAAKWQRGHLTIHITSAARLHRPRLLYWTQPLRRPRQHIGTSETAPTRNDPTRWERDQSAWPLPQTLAAKCPASRVGCGLPNNLDPAVGLFG